MREGFLSSNCHASWGGDGVCDIGCYELNQVYNYLDLHENKWLSK